MNESKRQRLLGILTELEVVGNFIFDEAWAKIKERYGHMSVKKLAAEGVFLLRTENRVKIIQEGTKVTIRSSGEEGIVVGTSHRGQEIIGAFVTISSIADDPDGGSHLKFKTELFESGELILDD